MTACEHAHLDGAYVLGALSPEERLAFERHLDGCPTCSAAVRDIAGLPGLLAHVSSDVVESESESGRDDPLPETLLPGLVREVRREQHRRRWVIGLAAAAAALVVGFAATAIVTASGDGGSPPSATQTTAPPQDMTQVGQHRVLASVSLTTVAWGTRLDLTCSYDEPADLYHDEAVPTYALVVHARDGRTEQVATWQALPGRTMHLAGATALSTDEISSVEVTTSTGRSVLELTS